MRVLGGGGPAEPHAAQYSLEGQLGPLADGADVGERAFEQAQQYLVLWHQQRAEKRHLAGRGLGDFGPDPVGRLVVAHLRLDMAEQVMRVRQRERVGQPPSRGQRGLLSGDVVPPPAAPVLLEVVFELELLLLDDDAFESELEFELLVEDDDLPEPVLVLVVCVVGLAALVVGTVRSGAPVVSLLPEPLPPHAVITIAISTATPTPTRRRYLRLEAR